MFDFEENIKTKKYGMVYVTLINLIFLLIFFFLLTGTIKKQDTSRLNLPQSAIAIEQSSDNNTIILEKSGKFKISDKEISPEILALLLQKFFKDNQKRPIFIKADAKTAANHVIKLMEIINKNGGSNVKLITQIK